MKIPYSLKEKILLASLIHDMEELTREYYSTHGHCHLELQALSQTACDVTRKAKRQNLTFVYIFRKKRSRWRKNSVPSRARKLARSRLPQPCPPNPPRNPCFFRPTIPGLRAEQSFPTATAASKRPRAAIEAIKGPRRACRGQFHSEHLPTPIPSPTIHLTPSTSSEPAPNTPPTPLPTPDFRPVRSPSEQTRSSPVSGPFAPLLTPGHRHSAELPRPCGVPPQPKKGTGARGIPRPTGVKLHPVTSPPEVIVTMH
ncbi:hypothetical protein GEV33_002485 [Tenebrio molitor]|uniref:Uncharacterized protein n=1 Tax=Tenebrio molitor TaxID=7067 RepID=A0A8J6HRF5_TENMO|nr:hypothetical protein GEV33_002485 [Tenebrio molitor]